MTTIRNAFLSHGLKPVLFEFGEKFQKLMISIGTSSMPNLFADDNIEIFTIKKTKTLIFIEIVKRYSGDILEVSILYKRKEELGKILRIFKKIKEFKEINEGTYFGMMKSEELDPLLEKRSPNGKLIENPSYGKIFEYFVSQANRVVINKIADFLGQTALAKTKEEIHKCLDKEERRVFEALLRTKKIFQEAFRPKCEKCNKVLWSTTYNTLAEARRAVSTMQFSCPARGCKSHNANIAEVYSIRLEAIKAKGGVWLEKFVNDELKKMVSQTWPGRMHGNDELDNVFILKDHLVVVECKDTSFGLTNLYSLLMKAQNLETDQILIITTQEVNKNVLSQIKSINDEEKFKVILIKGEQKDIAAGIERFLYESNKEFLAEIITHREKA